MPSDTTDAASLPSREGKAGDTPSPSGAKYGAKTWLRAQAAHAASTTRRLVALGLAQTGAAIVQAGCLASLVGPALVDRTASGGGPAGLAPAPAVVLFAVAALVRAALGLQADARAFEAGAAARRRLRTETLVAALAAGPHAAPGPAARAAAAVDGVDALDPYFARWLPAATLAWSAPLLVAVAVLAVDPVGAAIMAGGGLLVPLGMALAGIGAAAASQSQFAAMARLQARFLDRVRGIATIVLANQAEPEAQRLHEAARELAARTMRVLRVAFLSSAVLDAVAAAVLIALVVRAGQAWRAGTLAPVAATFTLVLVAEFFAPLRAFSAAYQDRIHATAAAETLGAGAAPRQAAAPLPVRTVAATGVTVAFEQVRFAWDPARPVALDGLSFRVPANETAILVGPSGAGKSTVIELLLGFIRPQSGRITLNGADLASITPQALARMTAWIGQRPTLFAATIGENIRFGREDASDSEVAAAARAAGLDTVVAGLPEGLDTVIGEAGYGLSGGQAQRVAIARAFLRNAPLLLLDEPTAHLDPATEADVLDSLRRLALGRTVLIAAHSSAAIAFSGRRIVLAPNVADQTQGAA